MSVKRRGALCESRGASRISAAESASGWLTLLLVPRLGYYCMTFVWGFETSAHAFALFQVPSGGSG